MPAYALLAFAVISEVIATMSLKASKGFTVLFPSILVVAGYGAAFFFLAQVLDRIPVGVAYAVWAGGGIVLTVSLAWVIFGQRLDSWGFVGVALILAGVLVLNLLSKASAD